MPDTYKLTLILEKNGRTLSGYDPLIRRLSVDQSQSFDEILATGGGDVALPIAQVGVTAAGDYVGAVGFTQFIPAGAFMVAHVPVAGRIAVELRNDTGAILTLPSGTVSVLVWHYN